MVDRSLILTLSFKNPGHGFIVFDNHTLAVQAKAARGWIPVTNFWSGGNVVMPGDKTLLLTLVPRDTEACRVRLNYSPETLKERLAAFLRDHARKLVLACPPLRNWLWPPWSPGWVPPPRRWRETQLEIPVPNTSTAIKPGEPIGSI